MSSVSDISSLGDQDLYQASTDTEDLGPVELDEARLSQVVGPSSPSLMYRSDSRPSARRPPTPPPKPKPKTKPAVSPVEVEVEVDEDGTYEVGSVGADASVSDESEEMPLPVRSVPSVPASFPSHAPKASVPVDDLSSDPFEAQDYDPFAGPTPTIHASSIQAASARIQEDLEADRRREASREARRAVLFTPSEPTVGKGKGKGKGKAPASSAALGSGVAVSDQTLRAKAAALREWEERLKKREATLKIAEMERQTRHRVADRAKGGRGRSRAPKTGDKKKANFPICLPCKCSYIDMYTVPEEDRGMVRTLMAMVYLRFITYVTDVLSLICLIAWEIEDLDTKMLPNLLFFLISQPVFYVGAFKSVYNGTRRGRDGLVMVGWAVLLLFTVYDCLSIVGVSASAGLTVFIRLYRTRGEHTIANWITLGAVTLLLIMALFELSLLFTIWRRNKRILKRERREREAAEAAHV
ncbi:secretory carrier membrane protein [Kipferlia bialata]|uniref:Secretory carrier membrane protein n=1 Tax=Kipferlia bialata TaxID=797122 RepID=A0A9K3D2G6_9EUKA|nr:secretory carrier membrane protein [Kipferlia bialata]|eukprot:g9512.t1